MDTNHNQLSLAFRHRSPQSRVNCPLQSSKKGPRSSLLQSGLGTLITGNTATNSCPGHLCQQYAFDGVSVRRDPTTLRPRRCHNCRPTKMTGSPVILGRTDPNNWLNFALAGLKANIQREALPRENKTQTDTKVSIETIVQWLRLIFSGLISTSASHALPCGRRGLNLTWLGSVTPR